VVDIDSDIFDHLPILLRYKPTCSVRRSQKVFPFENMWASDPSCFDTIKKAWGSTDDEDAVDTWKS